MKKHAQTLAGAAFGIALLIFLFKDTDWREVGHALRSVHWGWLVTSLLLVLVTFFTRVQRWSYIVRTAKPVSFRALFSATQIGFLGNFVLPGRIGEIIRAVVLSHLAGLPFTRCFAFVALDRVTDLFGLIAVMGVALIFFRPEADIPLPPDILDVVIPADIIQVATLWTMVFVAIILAGLGLLYFFQDRFVGIMHYVLRPLGRKISDKIEHFMRTFALGLHVFRSVGDMARAVGYSLLTWAVGVLCYHAVLEAFGLAAHWYTSVLVMVFLAVAVSIPGAPGFVGQFHLAVVAAVLISDPGADTNVARAAALMAHLVNLVPVALVGVYCLYTEKLGLLALRRESAVLEEQAPEMETPGDGISPGDR
ncbi:MAG: flippase-like domain-containing protein [Candidatus Hydrogenedentes bacterium]|nr:flippase-like domain-containing protein [Candidatus Hydrogenedentota bacterium]